MPRWGWEAEPWWGWETKPDIHGVWWYNCRNGTKWSRGPGERYEWWSPGPSQSAVVAPWLLELQRQQLQAMRMPNAHLMPNAHPSAVPPWQEDDAGTRRQQDTRRVTFAPMPKENAKPVKSGENTAVAEESGHPSNSCIPALAIDATPKAPSTRTRVHNKPLRIRTVGGSPGSSSTSKTQMQNAKKTVRCEAPGECGDRGNSGDSADSIACMTRVATAPRQPSSSKPVPKFPPPPRPCPGRDICHCCTGACGLCRDEGRAPPGLGVEVHPPPRVCPTAELEPISITDGDFQGLMASECFPDHPFFRIMGKGLPSPMCWVLQNFAEYGERIGFRESNKSHYNAALKYFRMMAQEKYEARDILLPIAPICIPQIIHDTKGPGWTFHESQPEPFSWMEMVGHIDNKLRGEQTQTDMALVVGRGIVSCVFKKDPIMYDHKSYQILSEEKKREMEANGTVVTTWDFVFRRVDGSECALHPSFRRNSITYREVCGPGGDPLRTTSLVPRAGPGKSDGRGTFQCMIRQTEDKCLKWDINTFVK